MAQIVPGRGVVRRAVVEVVALLQLDLDVATLGNWPGKALGEPSVKSTTMRNPDWLSDGTVRSWAQASYSASAVAVGPLATAASMWLSIETLSKPRAARMRSVTVVPEANVISAIRSLSSLKYFTNCFAACF